MKVTFLTVFWGLIFGLSLAAQTPSPDTMLTIQVEGAKTLELKRADIAKLPHRSLTLKDEHGKKLHYSGVELRELLKVAGAKVGKERRRANIAASVVIESPDGLQTVFGIDEVDSRSGRDRMIFVDTQDGKPVATPHDILVVRCDGPACRYFPPGKRLPANRITLRAGDH